MHLLLILALPLRYLILGDSTAVGIGGTPANGIAVQTAKHLERGRDVELRNLAVSGARIHDLLHEQLPRLGGFKPDLVLLDAGANDVTHLTSAGSVERDLRAIVSQLIALNCNVRIVVTGSPDMTTPPRIPWLLRGLAGSRTRALNTVFLRETEHQKLTFAPIAAETGPLFARDRTLFSEDDFHPNDRGYATWIAVLNPALDRALASQPSHCR
jgi:lysophospholipase L1-like esterase